MNLKRIPELVAFINIPVPKPIHSSDTKLNDIEVGASI